ncbi:MAG TPA: hypothetical protein VFH90_00215, partial [Candidatus Limnocylindria bacterium]|nr:hypothetical protein [Candidatus Limnocylindria bacterium]
MAACGESGPLPFIPTAEPTPVQPRELRVVALETNGGAPIAGATLSVDGVSVITDADGSATLTAMRGATVA